MLQTQVVPGVASGGTTSTVKNLRGHVAAERASLRHYSTLNTKDLPTLFEINGVSYCSSPVAIPHKLHDVNHAGLIAVIALEGDQKVTKQLLEHTFEEWASTDDVFQIEFLHHVIVTTPTRTLQDLLVTHDAADFLESLGSKWTEIFDDSGMIDTGLYYAVDRTLHEVYRVCDDQYGAFMASTIRGKTGDHLPLTGFNTSTMNNMIAVPSRVSSHTTTTRPLRGIRIAVKDNFNIKGLRTSLCNRAYLDTYPARTATAKCITHLLELGARVVGTTKLAAFAATEEPLECIDFHAPWNPRADGHQSPAGSSSGSGVAVAAYDWLDIAIGSDTSGSGRRPAHWNGCFALRPSHGVLDTTGLTISFEQFDTPSFFCRDIHLCKRFATAWYGSRLERPQPSLPPRLVVPSDYMRLVTNSQQLKIIESFVNDLEKTMNVKQTRLSFEDIWTRSPPLEAGGASLSTYTKSACLNSFFHDDYHNLSTFRSAYYTKYNRKPYVSPPVQFQWDLASKITIAERNEAIHRLAVFKDWFTKHISEPTTHRTIVVLPIENMSPRYRDEARTHFVPEGVPNLFLSPILGAPEVVVPIAEVTYKSRVSGCDEWLPVAVSLMGVKGSDIELLELVAKCLEGSGRPTAVRTGKRMFVEVGDMGNTLG